MKITEAIQTASDACVVYGLVDAYLEAVERHEMAVVLPTRLTRMPIKSVIDVVRCYAEARELYARCAIENGRLDPLLAEMVEVCSAGIERLRVLERPAERAA